MKFYGSELAFFPFHIHFKAATSAKAFYAAARPGFGQGREQFDFKRLLLSALLRRSANINTLVRLQKHFANTRCTAKIPIYLEWRMGIEHIWISALRGKQHLQDEVSVLGIVQSRPKIEPPSQAPAGGAVTTNLK